MTHFLEVDGTEIISRKNDEGVVFARFLNKAVQDLLKKYVFLKW